MFRTVLEEYIDGPGIRIKLVENERKHLAIVTTLKANKGIASIAPTYSLTLWQAKLALRTMVDIVKKDFKERQVKSTTSTTTKKKGTKR